MPWLISNSMLKNSNSFAGPTNESHLTMKGQRRDEKLVQSGFTGHRYSKFNIHMLCTDSCEQISMIVAAGAVQSQNTKFNINLQRTDSCELISIIVTAGAFQSQNIAKVHY